MLYAYFVSIKKCPLVHVSLLAAALMDEHKTVGYTHNQSKEGSRSDWRMVANAIGMILWGVRVCFGCTGDS